MTHFQEPVDDEDTAASKPEDNFLLPLLQTERKDPCTASNAVNKVRDLEVPAVPCGSEGPLPETKEYPGGGDFLTLMNNSFAQLPNTHCTSVGFQGEAG